MHLKTAMLAGIFLVFCHSSGIMAADSQFACSMREDALPLPPAEGGLPSVKAEAFFTASENGRHTLEGAIFDKDGNLLFCDTTASRVYKLSPQKELTLVVETPGFAPSGLALHKDGKLFMTALNLKKGLGQILALSPDGKNLETILPVEAGYLPNDLVFDKHGGFYFTDFRGGATVPAGGVYHVSPDFKDIKPVIPNMAQANGIALSPDGQTLWATEYAANRLHRVNLEGPTSIPPTGSKIPYTFIGPAPDSMRVDEDGNVYVAMVGQGRILIFNCNGLPIGQVLLPGRENGLNARSTSLAIHHDKKEMRIVSGNTAEAGKEDAIIFSAPAFAKGLSAAH